MSRWYIEMGSRIRRLNKGLLETGKIQTTRLRNGRFSSEIPTVVRDIIYGWARGFVGVAMASVFKPQTFTQEAGGKVGRFLENTNPVSWTPGRLRWWWNKNWMMWSHGWWNLLKQNQSPGLPSRGLTYPTLGIGKSSSNSLEGTCFWSPIESASQTIQFGFRAGLRFCLCDLGLLWLRCRCEKVKVWDAFGKQQREVLIQSTTLYLTIQLKRCIYIHICKYRIISCKSQIYVCSWILRLGERTSDHIGLCLVGAWVHAFGRVNICHELSWRMPWWLDMSALLGTGT